MGDSRRVTWDPGMAAQGKKLVREGSRNKKIGHIQFGLLAADEVQRMSEFQVCSRELFRMPQRTPAPHGCLDPRLGVSDKQSVCATCRRKLVDCAGHYGYIGLELPVFHIGYFKHILTICQCTCKVCSSVLLPQSLKLSFLRRLRSTRADALAKGAIYKKVVEKCKKANRCSNLACGAFVGTVKKVSGSNTLKLIHERYKGKHAEDAYGELVDEMAEASLYNAEFSQHMAKVQEDLTPVKVLELFTKMTDEDAELLWMDPGVGRPENLLVQKLLVPPVPIRPSVAMDVGGGSNEDDLTVKLQEIIDVNNALRVALEKGATMKMIMEDWDFLQVQVAQYINGEMPGLPRPLGASRPIRGLCQRLKGKSGRFRGNLSGKRVDFSGRTVISPDPNLRVDQVGVPERVARIMTYPEMVNKYNIHKLRKCVMNGPDKHPGANFIRPAGPDGFVKKLMAGESGKVKDNLDTQRERLARELKMGDIVERHMEDGDVVLFNRQPSLHKMSIMAHHAKVMPWRTFRFNECVCSPYNADFDGDEMNMHLPQTEEARAEAQELMAVANNLCTPRNGEPLVAATQDFLTAAYLITQKEIFFDRETFCLIVSYLGDAGEHVDMPQPSIFRPVMLWTGKQVMSLLVRPNRKCPVLVNLEMKERNYTSDRYFCAKDGYVCFHNSELVSGNLAKKALGDGSKCGLFYTLLRYHGPKEAARCMNRLAKICARYLGTHRGFSIGINDVTPSVELSDSKASLLANGYREADAKISDYEKGRLALAAGCNPIQSLESELNGLLGKLREQAGAEAMRALPWVNSPRIMAECGSKGSPLNISQMVACVGQQSVGGKRIDDGFVRRTLPHFLEKSLFPAAKGFVANSFYSGLTATEFFFHTMGGREGLVDTAVKTAETGYMARRLMKALEDLSMQYDRTVRNSEQTVVQFVYGDDGLNPQLMEGSARVKLDRSEEAVEVGRPVDLSKLLWDVCRTQPFPEEPGLSSAGLRAEVRSILKSAKFQSILPNGKAWLEEVGRFWEAEATALAELKKSLILNGMPSLQRESVEARVEERRIKREAREERRRQLGKMRAQAAVVAAAVKRKEEEEAEEEGRGRAKAPRQVVVSAATGSKGKGARVGLKKEGGARPGGAREGDDDMCMEDDKEEKEEKGKKEDEDEEDEEEESLEWELDQEESLEGTRVLRVVGSPEWRAQLGSDFRAWAVEAEEYGSKAWRESVELVHCNTRRVSKSQLHSLMDKALNRYHRAIVEPGEAVGAIGAQSISEPGTQMTLKTFHFAGVASMNVTLGVPRLKEIINASKAISTPIISAKLEIDDCKISARCVKANIEKTTLGQVAAYIKEVYANDQCSIAIKLNMEAIEKLQLNVTAATVRHSILTGVFGVTRPGVMRLLKESHVQLKAGRVDKLRILPPEPKASTGSSSFGGDKGIRSKTYFVMQALKACLPHVIIKGIPSVNRAVINVQESSSASPDKSRAMNRAGNAAANERYHLLVEGYGLAAVMGATGVDGRYTKSNHIIEVEKTLGVEAARTMISEEISYIMKAYGISIDRRHLLLLADVMSFKGEVLGITRFGVAKMRESVLMLASFEKTTDHLFDAAVHGRSDAVVGVSECIIMGIPIPVGTGLFKLLRAAEKPVPLPQQLREPLVPLLPGPSTRGGWL